MRKRIILLLCLGFAIHAIAGSSRTSSFEFLRTDFNPRTSGTGNAFTTMRADVSGVFVNPAGMAYSENRQFSFNYTSYLLDINGGIAAYSQPIAGFGIVTAAVTYMNYGSFNETDENGNETGSSFTPADFALTLGWADRFEKNFSYGVNVKYIHSTIQEYNASAIAFDFGMIWEAPFQKDLFIAFSLLNAGSNIEYYTHIKEELPLSTRLGFSKKLEHLPLEIAISLTDLNMAESFSDIFRQFSVGGEFRLSQSLRLRLGYDNRLHSDLKRNVDESQFGGVSGGLGIFIKNYRVDYSYSNYNLLGNIHRFGITGSID